MEHAEYSRFEQTIDRIRAVAGERRAVWVSAAAPEELRGVELEHAALGREMSDALTADVLCEVTGDSAFQGVAVAAALAGKPMRRDGIREVPVTLLGGTTIKLRAVYVRPERRRSTPGRKRKPGKRGRSGVGLYPTLAALGIQWNVTPALGAEVARQVTSSESLRPALEALKSRGIELGYKQTLRIASRFGQRAVALRNAWVERVHLGEARRSGLLAGKRVVVGIDGGRVRLRVPKNRGRRLKSGHRRFETPWQEPKLFVIYVVDEHGEVEAAFRPVYDGTLGDADAAYRLLAAYLKALGAEQAAELIIVGDGADWIWNRAASLARDLDLEPTRAVEVVDWFHAVEYLTETAALHSSWAPGERTRWLERAKTLLHAGNIDGLVKHIRALAQTASSTAINDRVGYFRRNATRMQYRALKKRCVPIGSGAVESGVRRVINLRLKGNSKFWLSENAEGMLLLRGYLKAGRFDDLVAFSYTAAIPWWESIAWQDPLGLDAVHDPSPKQLAA